MHDYLYSSLQSYCCKSCDCARSLTNSKYLRCVTSSTFRERFNTSVDKTRWIHIEFCVCLSSCLFAYLVGCFYIQSFWLNMLQSNPGCVYVCLCVCACVCLSVCLCHLYSPNGWTDFDETLHKWSWVYLPVSFFAVFDI